MPTGADNSTGSFYTQVFPVLKGGYSSGKSTCIQESARLMGQNLVFRTITYLTDFHILELVSTVQDQRGLKNKMVHNK